MEQKILLL